MNRPLGFFKTVFATIIGLFFGSFLLFFFILVLSLGSSAPPEPFIRNNSILHIELSGTFPQRDMSASFDELFPNAKKTVSLEGFRSVLEKAKFDSRIAGIWLEADRLAADWATIQEAKTLLDAFQTESGKIVYASTNDLGFSEPAWFLVSGADSVFSPPNSGFEFDGFVLQISFLKRFFENIGVEPEIARTGEFKAAIEPYIRENMSAPNREQLQRILDQFSSTFFTAAIQKTGHDLSYWNTLLNQKPGFDAAFALEHRLIDDFAYPNQVKKKIAQRLGVNEAKTVTYSKYFRVSTEKVGIVSNAGSKVAVLSLSGMIMPEIASDSPFGENDGISYTSFRKSIDLILKDSNVKALVLRIDSPGGSGATSDMIWNDVLELRKTMPVIASMAGTAASGGYYIAMAADSILAQETTITGSIGVFSQKFNAQELLNKTIGITFDEVKTHNFSNWIDPTRPFTSSERAVFQNFNDSFYKTFVSKVADSRSMTYNDVDKVAQGRVWTGGDALQIGLVDKIGGLQDAIDLAAELANIEEPNVDYFPARKELFEYFFTDAQAQIRTWVSQSLLSPFVSQQVFNQISNVSNQPQTLIPFSITIR